MSLYQLLEPTSVAVVGASEKTGSFGYNSCINSSKSPHLRVYYVNPGKTKIHGQQAYASLDELPEIVDCIMVCTPKIAVLDIVRQAAELHIGAAIIFASGFSEEGTPEGRALEEELAQIASSSGMYIMGPNCAGMLNNIGKVNLWGMSCSFDMQNSQTGIGVLAQSGFIASSILSRQGMNISYVISSGNGNMVPLEEYLEYLVENDAVSVIALYLEGVRDAVRFCKCLKIAAERRKPIVLLKVGKSAIGARAAASHTGNLAGSHEIYQAVFRKYGVVEVDCLEELLCVSQMFSVLYNAGIMPTAQGILGLNSSGGANTICADLCEANGITLPALSEEERNEIRRYIPDFATPSNPLDVTTALFGDIERTVSLLEVFERMESIGSVTIGCNIDISESKISVATCEALLEARRRGLRKPYFLVPSVEATPSCKYKMLLERNGVALLSSAKTAYRCIALLLKFQRYDPTHRDLSGNRKGSDSRREKRRSLTEYAAKKQLDGLGINVGNEFLIHSEQELRQVEDQLEYPLAMKVSSPDILHKTDCGGVKLNIQNQLEAVEAYRAIMQDCTGAHPKARIEGILVGKMAPKGLELILGVQNDDQFGPILLVGLGGVFVEIFKDVVLSPCPVSKIEAEELLKALRSSKMLYGYRGSAPVDIDALTDLMVNISQYAVHNPELCELDLNPVFVYGQGEGVRVVDALMIINE